MIKSATEAGSIPTFHYMDEIEVDGLLAARALFKNDDTLAGVRNRPPGSLLCPATVVGMDVWLLSVHCLLHVLHW
jgi:hypothetical protein